MAGAHPTPGRPRRFLMLWLSLSLILTYAVANPLDPRAEASSSVSKASTSGKPNSTSPASAKSDAIHSKSVTTAATAGTASPTPTPEAPTNTTSPELPANMTSSNDTSSQFSCHLTQAQWNDKKMGPFCEPKMYQNITAGLNYTVVWDPSAFNGSTNATVSFKYIDDAGLGDFPRLEWPALNKHGYVEITIDKEFLNEKSHNNLSLWITTDNNQTEIAGPIVSLVESSEESPSASSSPTPSASSTPAPQKSKDKKGMEVGIPIGLIFLFALGAALFLVLRRRRRGYGGNRSRGLGTAQPNGNEFRTGRSRGNSFKDEPAQSVELQPRNGHSRQDSMGTRYGSSSGGAGRDDSNAFRDELARQRDSRPW